MPKLPLYLDKLKDFRDKMVAHRDSWEKLRFPEDWINIQEGMDKTISAKQLAGEVDSYWNKVMENLENSESNKKNK